MESYVYKDFATAYREWSKTLRGRSTMAFYHTLAGLKNDQEKLLVAAINGQWDGFKMLAALRNVIGIDHDQLDNIEQSLNTSSPSLQPVVPPAPASAAPAPVKKSFLSRFGIGNKKKEEPKPAPEPEKDSVAPVTMSLPGMGGAFKPASMSPLNPNPASAGEEEASGAPSPFLSLGGPKSKPGGSPLSKPGGSLGKKPGFGVKAQSSAKIFFWVVLALVVIGIGVTVASAIPYAEISTGESLVLDNTLDETAPAVPETLPLNFHASIAKRGFAGALQWLVVTMAIGMFAAVLGDRMSNRQFTDVVVTAIMTVATLFMAFPTGTPAWMGVVFLLFEIGLVVLTSLQGEGKDFTPLAGWALLVAIGALVFTTLASVSNIFPTMIVTEVLPIVGLGYYFQTMNFSPTYFSLVVYLFALFGVVVATYETLRQSEDKTAPYGPILSTAFGLLVYFVFLLVFHIAAWISLIIGFLASVALAGMLVSQIGRQFMARDWGNKSPFDGALLLLAILLMLILMFGQTWWLVGV